MKRFVVISSLCAAVAALVPATALGKGASEATITGAGLGAGITLPGEGRPGGEALMQIAQEAGFFPAVFTQTPDPMLDERPAGTTLGPKYTVTYVMPGPNNEEDRLVQDLYPYARPSLVAYVPPGQPFWTTERTRGGWYVAGSSLKDLLVAAGLPESPPTSTPPSESPWWVVGPVAIIVGLGVLGGTALLLIRRRSPQPA